MRRRTHLSGPRGDEIGFWRAGQGIGAGRGQHDRLVASVCEGGERSNKLLALGDDEAVRAGPRGRES